MKFRARVAIAVSCLLCLSVAVPSSAEQPGAAAGQQQGVAAGPAAGQQPGVAAGPAAGQQPGATAGPAAAKKCTPADQCCQICTRGKACGKSCIEATKTCHKGRACACNASEV